MAILYNSDSQEFNIPGIVITLILLGLFIWLLVYLASPIKNDSCNPPRTHLNTLIVVSGYILWALGLIFAVYMLFIKDGGMYKKIIPQTRTGFVQNPFRRSSAKVAPSPTPRTGSVAAARNTT